EHVPDPAATVRACAELVRPDGHVFFATLSRNPKAYLFAIIGAEYLLRLLPPGTHDYAKFIRPSELAAMCRNASLQVAGITGMTYNPFTRIYALGSDTSVNYILHCCAEREQ
ncbi:MAG: bifunctional 2-polyprenyl-6-hydroxyphenol methylase/3-demethylubiquinol 3-O-methyltransferase UbiG, partial [Burkholderiales bacterium]|nr:bifunctional 2-polyprenyl-6-hydroxyphenol methylase/3-demethylubiquinol 3-O-methyltransferase UbiG [Burkholderiales bacterium]